MTRFIHPKISMQFEDVSVFVPEEPWSQQVRRDNPSAVQANFQALFKSDGDTLLKRLTTGLPGSYILNTEGIDENGVRDTVHLYLHEKNGQEKGAQVAHFTIIPENRHLNIDRLDAPIQHCGMGRVLMKNAFALCDDMEIKTAGCLAGEEHGPKFWLRFFSVHPSQAEMIGRSDGINDVYMGEKSFRAHLAALFDAQSHSNALPTPQWAGLRDILAIKDTPQMLEALYHSKTALNGEKLWNFFLPKDIQIHGIFNFSDPTHQARRQAFLGDAVVDRVKYEEERLAPKKPASPRSESARHWN